MVDHNGQKRAPIVDAFDYDYDSKVGVVIRSDGVMSKLMWKNSKKSFMVRFGSVAVELEAHSQKWLNTLPTTPIPSTTSIPACSVDTPDTDTDCDDDLTQWLREAKAEAN